MKNVFDYLDYYKNLSFEECAFNDMDNIVFSILSYLPLEMFVGKEDVSINDVSNVILKNAFDTKELRLLIGISVQVLENIYDSIRYKDVYLCNIVSVLDNDTQFCAVTFRFLGDTCYVAFRGTDNSLSGWQENLELSYMYPVTAQMMAVDYLEHTIKSKDKVIYVGGHSKGGNLAMTGAMEVNNDIFSRIKFIYNNDGPGFLKKEFNSLKYKNMVKKLKMFIPENSIVGILLLNYNDYKVVKSSEIGVMQHNLASWNCFGQFLVEGKLSKTSLKLQNQLNNWVEKSDAGNKELMVKTLFDILRKSGVEYLYQLKSLKFADASLMIKEANNLDDGSKEILMTMFKSLLFTDKRED